MLILNIAIKNFSEHSWEFYYGLDFTIDLCWGLRLGEKAFSGWPRNPSQEPQNRILQRIKKRSLSGLLRGSQEMQEDSKLTVEMNESCKMSSAASWRLVIDSCREPSFPLASAGTVMAAPKRKGMLFVKLQLVSQLARRLVNEDETRGTSWWGWDPANPRELFQAKKICW